MLCGIVALYQAQGQALIGMCLFLPREQDAENMESRIEYPYRPEPGRMDEAVTVFHSLLCAMGRFYAVDRALLTRDVPRLLLLNRIDCGLAVELNFAGLRDRCTPDLIHIEEQLNLGIRVRDGAVHPLAVEFTFGAGRPKLDRLRAFCGAEHYRLGVAITLTRQCYRAAWFASEPALEKETARNYAQWLGTAPFLDSPQRPLSPLPETR